MGNGQNKITNRAVMFDLMEVFSIVFIAVKIALMLKSMRCLCHCRKQEQTDRNNGEILSDSEEHRCKRTNIILILQTIFSPKAKKMS